MYTRIKGDTKLYGVIGDPIDHSLSPEIHNSIFNRLKDNCIYIPLRIKTSHLEESIPVLRNNFRGFNVTIPHKEKIIPYLDEIDEKAKGYGAVNTVEVVDGKFIGYNTDGYGFMKSLIIEGIHVKEQSILLVGAGGAARVIAFELLQQGAFLTITNRNIHKAEKLKEELSVFFDEKRIKVCSMQDDIGGNFGVVHATPVGMYPNMDAIPIDETALKGVQFVYDLIYNPYQTKLLSIAKNNGSKYINGFSMLFHQAVKAQEIWRKRALAQDGLENLYEEIKDDFYKLHKSV